METISYLVSFSLNHCKKIISWLVFNMIITYMIHRSIKPFYKKKQVESVDNENNQINVINNIHDEYPEFKKLGNEPSFIKIYFALLTYFWPKVFLWVGILAITFIQCK